MNVALKVAIIESRKRQGRIAKLAGMREARLSHIVRGRDEATDEEKRKLAKLLDRSVDELFPQEATV